MPSISSRLCAVSLTCPRCTLISTTADTILHLLSMRHPNLEHRRGRNLRYWHAQTDNFELFAQRVGGITRRHPGITLHCQNIRNEYVGWRKRLDGDRSVMLN